MRLVRHGKTISVAIPVIILLAIVAGLSIGNVFAQSGTCDGATPFNYISDHITGQLNAGESEWQLVQVNDTGTAYITLLHPNQTNFSLVLTDSCDSLNLCESFHVGNFVACRLTLLPGNYYLEARSISGSGMYYLDFDLDNETDYLINEVIIEGSNEYRPGARIELKIPVARLLDTPANVTIIFNTLDESNTSIYSEWINYSFSGIEEMIFNLSFRLPIDAKKGSYSIRAYISETNSPITMSVQSQGTDNSIQSLGASNIGINSLGSAGNGINSLDAAGNDYEFIKDNAFEVIMVNAGDINNDNRVNIFDLATMGFSYKTTPGNAKWNPWADLNQDNKINIFDLAVVGLNYGKSYIPCDESWQCGEWGACTNSQQNRTCIDTNACGTTDERPNIMQPCIEPCIPDWVLDESWSVCDNSGYRNKEWIDLNNCSWFETNQGLAHVPLVLTDLEGINLSKVYFQDYFESGLWAYVKSNATHELKGSNFLPGQTYSDGTEINTDQAQLIVESDVELITVLAGDLITLYYDNTNLNLFMPPVSGESYMIVYPALDGSTYFDSELTQDACTVNNGCVFELVEECDPTPGPTIFEDDFSFFNTAAWEKNGPSNNVNIDEEALDAVYVDAARNWESAAKITHHMETGNNDFSARFDFKWIGGDQGMFSVGWTKKNDYAYIQSHMWYTTVSEWEDWTGVTFGYGGNVSLNVEENNVNVPTTTQVGICPFNTWCTVYINRTGTTTKAQVEDRDSGFVYGWRSVFMGPTENYPYFHFSTWDNMMNSQHTYYNIDNLRLVVFD